MEGAVKKTSAKRVAVAKVSISKFQEILAATGQIVLDRRSDIVYRSAVAAMDDKINALQRQKDSVEIQLLNLTDLSVNTKDSLRPGNANFNAAVWINEVCELTLQIKDLDEELEIAELVKEEYFVAK
jgi:hypothetical protein